MTKAVVGTPLAAWALETGRLFLDEPVKRHLPEVDPGITLRHLLTHSAGFPAHIPLYEEITDAWGTARSREVVLRSACSVPLVAPPGRAYIYSDVGFLVLLALLEHVGGASVDQLFSRHLQTPANVRDLRWGWPGAAATERCPVRGILVEGTVHDLNAAALGGISTHAGLFGTSRAVARLVEILGDAALAPANAPTLPGASLATLLAVRGPGSHRGGWDGISRGYTSTGRWFPEDTVGHLGYTGTSVWWSPSRRTVVAFLTNRIHPEDDLTAIRAARPLVHDAVADLLGWSSPSP